jgi:hypothetical protein
VSGGHCYIGVFGLLRDGYETGVLTLWGLVRRTRSVAPLVRSGPMGLSNRSSEVRCGRGPWKLTSEQEPNEIEIEALN